MREIKFRVFRKSNNEMVGWDVLAEAKSNSVFYWINLQQKNEFENNIVMQYTGRKASNYIDIYEGDIVRHLNGMIYEVCFDEAINGFDFREQLNEDGIEIENKDYLNCDSEFALEVIGNIYENPELLETI